MLVLHCRALSEADQSLDSTQMMGEDDYGPGLQRRSSRQRRAREWGDDMAADWTCHKGSQSDDYSDEGGPYIRLTLNSCFIEASLSELYALLHKGIALSSASAPWLTRRRTCARLRAGGYLYRPVVCIACHRI